MTALEMDVELMEVEGAAGLLEEVPLVVKGCDCCWTSGIGTDSVCVGTGSS